LHFQQGDVVFELQFALFQAAQLQLVVVAIENQHIYDCIEVAVFHVELDEAAPYFFCVSHEVPGSFISLNQIVRTKMSLTIKMITVQQLAKLATPGFLGA
jgi:hypothetical protein